MPGSADRHSEEFARLLDDVAGGPAPDGQLRRDLAVAALLVDAGQRVRPDDAARERMRARILAGLAEPPADPVVTPIDALARRRSAAAGVQGRLLVAAAAALCLLVALSAMSLVLARDALPGDALYGVKRSAESAELGLTFGDEPRGFKHLQFATARIDEIEALAARAVGSGELGDAQSYLTALQAFDTDAAAGSRLLIETATNGGGGELAVLRGWAEQQRGRLAQARSAMPAKATEQATGSVALLDRVGQRVATLQARLSCLEVTSGARDDVGLLPAHGTCLPAAAGSGLPSVPPGGQQGSESQPRLTPSAPAPSVVLPAPPTGEQPQTPPIGPLDPGVTEPDVTVPSGGSSAGDTSTGVPAPTATSEITVPLPLPLPELPLPPLLPGLPGLKIG